uniref:hypothetical protein n=1 Tax=Acinetobacter baumannii TaxID=470 RepID=UPI001C074C7B
HVSFHHPQALFYVPYKGIAAGRHLCPCRHHFVQYRKNIFFKIFQFFLYRREQHDMENVLEEKKFFEKIFPEQIFRV